MKIQRIVLGLLVGFSASAATVLPSQADSVTNELQRTNELINEAGQYLQDTESLVQQRQAQKQQLGYYCQLGYENSCSQLRAIEQQELQWLMENDCRYRTGLNSCYR